MYQRKRLPVEQAAGQPQTNIGAGGRQLKLPSTHQCCVTVAIAQLIEIASTSFTLARVTSSTSVQPIETTPLRQNH